MRRNSSYFLFIIIWVIADQATKFLVARLVPLYGSRTVIPGFFNLSHIHNKGAIFGFFSQEGGAFIRLVLTAASFLALGLVIYYFIKTPASERFMKFALTLILAGALGNLIDRLFQGFVIDFLDFHIGSHHWPFFNLADSSITVGACLLVLVLLRRKPA